MACRIGMATDVEERVREHVANGDVPRRAQRYVIDDGLTYEEALRNEAVYIRLCEADEGACDGSPGGKPVPGPVWSIYRIDWEAKQSA